MIKFIRQLVKDCSGPTAIEYGLIAALVAIATISGLTTLGTTINTKHEVIANTVANAG